MDFNLRKGSNCANAGLEMAGADLGNNNAKKKKLQFPVLQVSQDPFSD